MIKLINVCKTYKKKDIETKALDNVSLEFQNKGFYFILGESGSGKTTLLNVMGGLDKVDSGSIIVNDVNIKDYSSYKMDEYKNTNIGFIFQNYNLIDHLTIFENIILPTKIERINQKEIKEKAYNLLEKLNLEKEASKYPKEVSGGQLQRAAIARALITDAKIILADEPTGALDSKNSKIIMDILKDISKERLVVMVTHNEKVAYEYADKVIRLKDGFVIQEINNNELEKSLEKEEKKKFKFISFLTAIKLSFRNMSSKIFRTLLTILATSVGIVSTCLVLMVSNSMTNYTEYAQKQALGAYPITISSTILPTDEVDDNKEYSEYPKDNIIHITNDYRSYYDHVNVFDEEYLNYVRALDTNLYSVIDYGTALNMHILSKMKDKYEYLSLSSYIRCLNDDITYVKDEYELLYGENYPSSYTEVALVVDKNNCIDAYVLDYLGIDYKDIEEYTFEEICKKEFKVVDNNTYYKYNEEYDRYYYNSDLEDIYNTAPITIKVSCVLRVKKSATTKLYSSGLLYTSALQDMVHENCMNSDIVRAQVEYGLDKNVFTGVAYTDQISDFTTIKKEYLLENNLKTLGYYYNTSYIRIYTDKFEYRNDINNYLKAYNIDKDAAKQIIYRDYMGTITEEFERFIKILTNVLIIFSTISLIVSSIMIALLMYISVVEREKEIGILRTLGYSKVNVGTIFLTEAAFIGFTSGVIGVIIARVAIKPILRFVSGVVTDLYSTDYDITQLTNVDINIVQLTLLVLGAILVATFAALIPAIIASLKEPVKAIRHQGE